mgnify:CR=1 FL=1
MTIATPAGMEIRAEIKPGYDQILTPDAWARAETAMLPSADDNEFIASLMKPCWERGQYASWVSAPKTGIDGKPGDFEYVTIHGA